MQVLIHTFSYSVLPPCLRHCAIHSRHFAGWSRGSSRFSFLSFFLPSFFLVLRDTVRGEDTNGRAVAGCGGSFRNPAGGRGVLFSFRLPSEKGEGRRAYESVLYAGAAASLIWNTYTRGYSASLYLTRMQIPSILDFSWMRRSRGWWLVLRYSHFSIFFQTLSFLPPAFLKFDRDVLDILETGSW